MADDDAPVGVCFAVELDKRSIGVFSTCEGLGLEVVMEQREEGGNNTMIWQLPTRMKYTNIKLSRPIGRDSHKLTEWITKALARRQADHRGHHGDERRRQRGRQMVAGRCGSRPLDRSLPEPRLTQGVHRNARNRPPRFPAGE